MRVTLDASNWAEILDTSELRSGDRRAVNRSLRLELDENERPVMSGAIFEDQRDALLKRVVTDWSLPFPLPKDDPASLDKLTLPQEDALSKAIQPHLDLMNGKVNPEQRDTDPTTGSAS